MVAVFGGVVFNHYPTPTTAGYNPTAERENPGRRAATTARRPVFIGLSMSDLRQDRNRDAAVLTGDPVHLMQLFDVSSNTAMRYIGAAHPERTAKPPRYACGTLMA